MSKTKHHSKKHGTVKTGKGTKNRGYGYEFWSARPGNPQSPGKDSNVATHRAERRGAKETEKEDE